MTSSVSVLRKWTLSGLIALLAATLGLLPAVSASAVGNLDQQATGTSTRWYYIMNNVSLAQDFTAGVSGTLDRFTIDGFAFSSPSAALTANIYAVDGSGFPTGSSLASASVTQTAIPTTVTTIVFDFGTPATVTAGTQYSVVLSTTGSGEYHFENATSVPAGAKGVKPGAGNVGWQNYIDSGVTPNQTSFRFATYVSPITSPSPSATSSSVSPNLANTGLDSVGITQVGLMAAGLLFAGILGLISAKSRSRQRQ